MTARHFTLLPALACLSLAPLGSLFLSGCSETADDTPGPSGGSSSNVSGAGGTSAAGKGGSGGVATSGGSSGSAGASAGTTGGAGTSSAGTSSGGAGAGGTGNTAGGGAGGGGAGAGSAGSSGASAGTSAGGTSAGDAGSGGSSAGTGGGGSAGDASGGTAGSSAGTAGTGGGPSDPCPANATFCSGFESAELPEGAVFKLNGDPATPWTSYFEVDSTKKKTGNSSLRTKSEVNGYRMLAVPTGGATFWVRMYVMSDKDLGEIDHNVFAQAARNDEPNDGEHMEFAEDVGLSLHFDDSNIRWPDGFGRLTNGTTMPYKLVKDEWHCIEFMFDGQGKAHQVYVAGELLIDAQSFPASSQPWTHFKFGYNALHGTVRNTWYDDVAVAPTRVGCL